MTVGSTQPQTEMSTRNLSGGGGKGDRCIGLITLKLSFADCIEIWEPQPPGTYGPVQASTGIAFDHFCKMLCTKWFFFFYWNIYIYFFLRKLNDIVKASFVICSFYDAVSSSGCLKGNAGRTDVQVFWGASARKWPWPNLRCKIGIVL
jgi:hypothetical protein